MVSATPARSAARLIIGVLQLPAQSPTHESDLDPDSLGSVIRLARKALGQSQEAFGSAIGMTQSQVSQLERGAVRTPQLETLEAIAAHTGLEKGYLLELAHWPGAFRRGIPTEFAQDLSRIDDGQRDAVFSLVRYLSRDGHELSKEEMARVVSLIQHFLRQSRIRLAE